MNLFQYLADSFNYVYNQPSFWGAMGFTTAIAMFIGVLLYDGNIKEAIKGVVAIGSYIAMLLYAQIVRIVPILMNPTIPYHQTNYGQPFSSVATIFYITVFWILGLVIGVNLFRHKRYKLK